jgi:hypothetical protein
VVTIASRWRCGDDGFGGWRCGDWRCGDDRFAVEMW